MKEKQAALFIGNGWVQNCEKRFGKAAGQKFSDSDWLQHIYKGSNKTRFQYCKKNPTDVLLYILVLFKDTGGNLIDSA